MNKNAKYSAMDIALYCIYYCSQQLNNSISNLELQKILYYIQGAFLAKCKFPCFSEEIVAWKYGPVVEDVYYSLRKFGSNQMVLTNEPDGIDVVDKEIINSICTSKTKYGALPLAQKTHEEEPWLYTTQSAEIMLSSIEKYFSENPDRLELAQ